MTIPTTKPQLTSFAPQFLVDNLARSMAYYQRIGFGFGEPWDGFYAIGRLDGLELHLKERPSTRLSADTGVSTSISTPRAALMVSKHSTRSAPRMAHGSSSR